MKKGMNNEREHLNYVYNMIIDKGYDLAEKRLEELRNNCFYRPYLFEIEFLTNFLEEQRDFYGDKKEKIQEFLPEGRDCLRYDELDNALEYFTAGAYVTEFPLFYYMAGKALYNIQDRQDEGVKYLEEYLKRKGASKAISAYTMLEKYYEYLDPKQSKNYNIKKNKLKLISSINYVRKDRSKAWEEIKEVEDLGKNKEIDKLYEMFDNSTDEIKLRIIGVLYKRGFRKQADALYKKNRREIEKHSKNSKRLVYELDRNKTLFINKGKHDING